MKGFRQKFSPYVKQYEYDERKDCLVELKTMKNQQELIQSSENCALDRILERFGYSNVSLNAVLNNHREDVSNLDFYDKLNFRDNAVLENNVKRNRLFQIMLKELPLTEQFKIQDLKREHEAVFEKYQLY